MSVYDKYKDSGTSWLGQIPSEWKTGVIGSLYKLRNTKVSDVDYPPLSVTMKGIVPQLENAAKTDAHDARKLVLKGDFAINSRSDRRGSCGISEYDGSVSLINTVLTPRKSMNPKYYDWLFHTIQFADEYYKQGHGIVNDLWTTRWDEMKRIIIPVPSDDEQRAIAKYLDKKITHIDSVISEAKASIEEYKAWKASIIYEAVTKGLDPNVEMKDSEIEWIGEMPFNWSMKPIKRIVVARDGGAWGDEVANQESDGNRICMRIADFDFDKGKFKKNNINFYTERNYSHDQIEKLTLQKGDLLIEKSGGGEKTPVGRIVLFDLEFDALYANFMDRIRVDFKQALPKYISYYWRAMYYKAVTTAYIKQTTGIQNLNISALLEKENVLLPEITVQEKIVNFLDIECERIDTLISEKNLLVSDLELYKKSLIFEVVTGKRKVV